MGIGVVVIYTCIWANMTIFFKYGYRHNAFLCFRQCYNTIPNTSPLWFQVKDVFSWENINIDIIFFYEHHWISFTFKGLLKFRHTKSTWKTYSCLQLKILFQISEFSCMLTHIFVFSFFVHENIYLASMDFFSSSFYQFWLEY